MPPKKPDKQAVVRHRRRTVEGVVTSDKMQKTITVRVERLVQHPTFGKFLRKHYVCYAHDEKGEAKRGDKVALMETRPMSKSKHWRLVKVLARAAAAPDHDAREAARPPASPDVPAAASTPPTA